MKKYKVDGIGLSKDPQFKPCWEKTAEEVGVNPGHTMLRDKGYKAEKFFWQLSGWIIRALIQES